MKFLFEVSWEVCNMVGGIYTVIRSKASEAVAAYGDNYFLIGPWLENNSDFVETDEPQWKELRPALEAKGLRVRMGRWEVDGRPKTILVDFKDRYDLDKLLYTYWQHFGVDSMTGGWDYIEPVMFSTACAEVIETFHENLISEDDEAVAQFHEWMCGGGLLHLKKNVPEMGTVFTTHATMLGRAMASSGHNIYAADFEVDPGRASKRYGVAAKVSMETVCAREADYFTTVSQVTAEEAGIMLGRRPALAVFNGINAPGLRSFEEQRSRAKNTREKVLTLAGRFLQKDLPANTRLFASSGRYEFHNKGFDVFLEALARLEEQFKSDDSAPPVVAWFLVAGGHKGLCDDVRRRVSDEGPRDFGQVGIYTHRLYNEEHDSILNACHRLGLRNDPSSKINVIFTPAYLDGNDGLFNLPYEDVLAAFDLGVFPSYYEPWGYTPLESIAWCVPTVTTDLAGFGRWVQSLEEGSHDGVAIIRRTGREDEEVVPDLTSVLADIAKKSEEDLEALRRNARFTAEKADWRRFFKNYLRAFERAAFVADRRVNSLDTSAFSDDLFISFQGTEGPGPHYRCFTVIPELPKNLSRLREVAYNLWWAWHPEAEELFTDLGGELWERSGHNPVKILSDISYEELMSKSKSKPFVKKYDRVIREMDEYLKAPGRVYEDGDVVSKEEPVAYFSMEFCLHESLPIYSGGLGVLSGDHLKAASDLNIPLVGVGLFYRQGYFKQRIDRNGQQIEQYPFLDTSSLPVVPVKDRDGKEVRINVDLAGRTLYARAWRVDVGRIPLYLLDTDIEENSARDRQITWQLYGGDRRVRLEQEILLGIGGMKLIEDALEFKPAIYHLNEGHCGFLLFERIHRYMAEGLSFQEAREAVKATSVFTTHTPVPAGNEEFDLDLMETYFTSTARNLGISFEQLAEMGLSRSEAEEAPFSMTVLALKLTSKANAVSKLHSKVCKHMWKDVWKGVAVEEMPIDAITNGIHLGSWIGRNMRRLLGQYIDVAWDENHDEIDAWARVDEIPDEMLWYEHAAQKKNLIEAVKERVLQDYVRRGEDPRLIRETIETLNSNALTIGFARRFATYKRASLLFKNREALVKMLNDPERPVQILFAGKAHPADGMGKDLIRMLIAESRTEEFRGKIVYLENYDMALGRLLTQGADVWLNTPLRPHEASGTSGMKTLTNGGLNCSILDGWWDEAYEPGVGWAISSRAEYVSREHQDQMDNLALMQLLEQEIIPMYYDINDKGIPIDWVAMMKNALMKLAPVFTTQRMVDEYHRSMYLPTAKRGRDLSKDGFAGIRALTGWKRKLSARFSTLQIARVKVSGLEGDVLRADAKLRIELAVDPGKLEPRELRAELLIGRGDGENFEGEPKILPFGQGERVGTEVRFELEHKVEDSGSFMYAVRVVPIHPLLARTQETGLVRWL